jgi:hypothetical protein
MKDTWWKPPCRAFIAIPVIITHLSLITFFYHHFSSPSFHKKDLPVKERDGSSYCSHYVCIWWMAMFHRSAYISMGRSRSNKRRKLLLFEIWICHKRAKPIAQWATTCLITTTNWGLFFFSWKILDNETPQLNWISPTPYKHMNF